MGSKYKYEGIPLDEYCREHGLNFGTQRRRVRLYLRKNPNVSSDDATKYVIDNRSRVIYKYDGKSLVDYCKEKELAYDTIIGRIKVIKKNNPKISNDEATRLAVEEFTDSRIKYFYEGKTLDEYCEEHGLNADTQRNRIKNYLDEHPTLPIEAVIKNVLSTCGKVFYKYEYDGKSLADYCRENDISYDKMISRVERIKELDSSISDGEATRIAIEEFSDNGIKYFYEGMPLVDYCRLHPEYNYDAITLYIRRKLEKNPNGNVQEIINSYFLIDHSTHVYHFVDGIPLYDYCEENGIVYSSIISALSAMRKNPKYFNMTDEEKLKIALVNYQTYVRCYLYYKGTTLFHYCKENDYSYNTIYGYIFRLIEQNPDITLTEAMDIAFANIRKNGIKYYYQGQPLIEYCRQNNLNEKFVRARVTDRLRQGDISVEDAIQESIDFYTRKQYYNNLKKVFQFLKKSEDINELVKEVLDFLNIDVENVIEMSKFYSNLSDIVNIIWYFHDNEDGKKLSISMEALKEVLCKMKNLETLEISKITEIDILFLIGLYKSNLFDTRYLIILHQENYHFSRINSFANYYGLDISVDFKRELNDNLNLLLLEIIDKLYNNNVNMIISYINKSVDGYLRGYFAQYSAETAKVISLETPIDNNSNSKNRRIKLDKVASPVFEDRDEFSDEMMTVLNDLDKMEKLFIICKFQMCLSETELAARLGMSLEELSIFEKNVLSKLRNNDGIKVLFHTREE